MFNVMCNHVSNTHLCIIFSAQNYGSKELWGIVLEPEFLIGWFSTSHIKL